MKRLRCKNCGGVLLRSEDGRTGYCPKCQKDFPLEDPARQSGPAQGSYIQFMMDYDGTEPGSPAGSPQGAAEKDLLSEVSIGFQQPAARSFQAGAEQNGESPADPASGAPLETSLQPSVPAIWDSVVQRTDSFSDMSLNIGGLLRFARDAFEQMTEAERAVTVPVWRAYLKKWAASNCSAFRDQVKTIQQAQEKRQRKLSRKLASLSNDLRDQQLAQALDDEEYRRRQEQSARIRESSGRWSLLSFCLLLVSALLLGLAFVLMDLLEGFFFYGTAMAAAGLAGLGVCSGVLISELSRRRAAERDLANLAAGKEETNSEQQDIMVLSQAETEILREEIRKSSRILDACRLLLGTKSKALEKAMFRCALELSSIEKTENTDRVARALKIVSWQEPDLGEEQLPTLSVFSFEEEDLLEA